MKEFVVLLRGINVGGKNRLPMSDLRSICEAAGFSNVRTYIQSGNIVLESESDKSSIADAIHTGIEREFGYDIKPFVIDSSRFRKIVDDFPFAVENPSFALILFVQTSPDLSVSFEDIEPDEITATKFAIYAHCPNGISRAIVSQNEIEKRYGVSSTTGRNLNSSRKICRLLS